MDKPSKARYAITNRTRQILTVSFVALGSCLIFTGSSCEDTAVVTNVIVVTGAGFSQMDFVPFCLNSSEQPLFSQGAIYGGGAVHYVTNPQKYGNENTAIPSRDVWFAYTPAELKEKNLHCKYALEKANIGEDKYPCSFSPNKGPGTITLYNCGYDLRATVTLYGVTGGPGSPSSGTAIYFRPTPGASTMPTDVTFASITLTNTITIATVPTSMPQGLYTMTTTADIACAITNKFSDHLLPVLNSDSLGVDVEIVCAMQP